MDCSRGTLRRKATEGSSSMVPHIPFEVITEILANLPVKSLLKFRVVCKSWCSLISNRQFVRKHLSRNTSSPKRAVHLSIKDLTFYSLHDSVLVEEILPLEFPIQNPENLSNYIMNKEALPPFYTIMGYCDGLLCVNAYTDDCSSNPVIFLWNPSTRESKILPFAPELFSSLYISCWGFGYDYKSDDYKVLVARSPVEPKFPLENNYNRDSGYNSMMYTLKTNSWRRIQDFPFDRIRMRLPNDLADSSATLVNGALHWMVRQSRPRNNPWKIISFNLTTETYMEVAQPADYSGVDKFAVMGIGSSNRECLCLLFYNRATHTHDFWVMKEYGVRESWTISAKIPYCVDAGSVHISDLRPVTWFPENGEILFTRIRRELAIYNENNNAVSSLYQIPDKYSSTLGDVYVETLVSPNSYCIHGANESKQLIINIVGRMKRVERNV